MSTHPCTSVGPNPTRPANHVPGAVNFETNPATSQAMVCIPSLLQHVDAGVIVHGAGLEITSFNAKALEILGVTATQMRERNPANELWRRFQADGAVIAPKDLPASRAAATKRPVRDVVVGFNHPVQGALRWVVVSAIPTLTPDQRVAEVVVTFMDITSRIHAERALRDSEERFQALFEQAAVGIALTDFESGRFRTVNPRMCEIMGYDRDELVGLSFPAITHLSDVEASQAIIQQLKSGATRASTCEKRYVRKDGQTVWVALTVSAISAPGERPDSFIAIAQDVTERKQLEEHFREAHKMEAMGQLAGGIAHDFNNILTAINGYTQLAQLGSNENQEVSNHLEAVLRATDRATNLVRQILTFSRREKNERRPIRLEPVVEETLRLLRATIPSTVEFVTSLAADAPPVVADSSQIHQVLMNLGTNAWHAIGDGPGQLHVRLERYVVDEPLTAAQPRLRAGVYARLSVSDTGCGMEASTLRRIFEPFFTTKAPGKGTGLGLAVVHGIMENHDGAIVAHSRPGEGTEFQLYFPAHSEQEIHDEVKAVEPLLRGRGQRLLLVDDEELLAQLGQRFLTALGYTVEIATQPAAALAMVRADPHRFSLVLTDLTMPSMTGLVFASQLRQIQPELPIILMTGYCTALTTERIEAAGISQTLLKPFSIRALGATVHEALIKSNGNDRG